MPELPEVETIRRGLENYIVGKTIEGVEVRLEKLFTGQAHEVVGAGIEAVRRFGKGLVIDLSNDYSITAHVKMTGQFVFVGIETKNLHPKLGIPQDLPNKHTHVIFTLKGNEGQESTLFYNDIRQFGWLKVVKTSEVKNQPFFKALGPEPPVVPQSGTMDGQAFLTLPVFQEILHNSNVPIKPLLMDQGKISGIGNIYANDALYASCIDPRRMSSSLTQSEAENLFTAVLEVLEKGLQHGGASETNYIQVDGGKGEYQNHFLVYGKDGEKCMRCGTLIERIKQGGRSTFLCPTCQK